jgi:hypothetical protein
MMEKLIVAVIVLLAFCCSAAVATPTLNLASGYVQLPDANVLKMGEMQFSAAYVATEGESELSDPLLIPMPCEGDSYNLRLLAGIGGRTEVGLGYQKVHKIVGDARTFTFAAKANIHENAASGLTIALGASYRNWVTDMEAAPSGLITVVGPLGAIRGPHLDVDLPAITSVYLAINKDWGKMSEGDWSLQTTLGIAYDHYTSTRQDLADFFPAIASGGIEFDGSSLKIPAQSFLKPTLAVQAGKSDWAVIGEYKPELSNAGIKYASAAWTAAVRKQLDPKWTATLGFTNLNIPYSDSNAGIFFDVSLAFGP